jgi:hypothetical protein
MESRNCRTPHSIAPRLLYSRTDSALQLSISVRSLDYLISEGRLKPRRIGGRVLIHHDDLIRLADRGDNESMKPVA